MSYVYIFAIHHHLCLLHQHFCVRDTTNLNYVHLQHASSLRNAMLVQWLNYWQRGASMTPKNLFFDLFLVCFIVLQVIAKGSWWVGFNDGAQSRLFNEDSSCVVWITTLQGDWQEDLWGAKRRRWEEYIWCWLKSIEQKLCVMKRSWVVRLSG